MAYYGELFKDGPITGDKTFDCRGVKIEFYKTERYSKWDHTG